MRIRIPLRVAASILLVAGFAVSSVILSGPSIPGEAGTSGPAGPSNTPPASAVTTALSFRLPALNGHGYTPNARNLAMRSSSTGPLLLFLPATGHVPRDYEAFLTTARSVGYHVLGLDYWNLGLSVAKTCGHDAHCYGDVQANRFDGSHPGRFSSVPRSESILSRLIHALTVLGSRDPQGGWNQYLSDGEVQWSRIVLAGHSQGGGESAYIAHRHRVQGVLMFASPVATDGHVSASWMSTTGATAMSRYYGFDDVHDVYFNRVAGSWHILGVGGASGPEQVGIHAPRAGSTHRVVSDLELGSPGQAHDRVVSDAGPRTSVGAPVFQPIWRWMLTAVYRAGGRAS
jgi:hypothetical protein